MGASHAQEASLHWENLHSVLSYKRLERGRFSFVADIDPGATSIEMDARDLSGLLEGLEVSKARAASRWDPRYPAHVSGP
jgi:hypothetical protein